jgi:hypothetical protein
MFSSELTRAEVFRRQIQKDGCEKGTECADGDLGPRQARKLFGTRYTIQG